MALAALGSCHVTARLKLSLELITAYSHHNGKYREDSEASKGVEIYAESVKGERKEKSDGDRPKKLYNRKIFMSFYDKTG